MIKVNKEKCFKKVNRKNEQEGVEQRRSTRLGAIIAIAAIVGTLCMFVLQVAVRSINVWPVSGLVYGYLQVLCTLTFATLLIIIFDIIMYVIVDLKRYNIVQKSYKKYDKRSDEYYADLMADFEIYTAMLLCTFAVYVPLSTMYAAESDKWRSVLATCIFGGVGFALFLVWAKNSTVKRMWEDIKRVLSKLFKWFLVGGFCYIVSATFAISNLSVVSINFAENGNVEISNRSATSYKELEIEVYNSSNDMIYNDSIQDEDLLKAKENKYIVMDEEDEIVSEGLILDEERLYWKYLFNLDEIFLESGKYYVAITIYENGEKVVIRNMFLVQDDKYIFAKENIEKEY